MNLIKDEEEEEIQLPAYHVQSSQPQVVTTMSSQNNQNLEIIRQSEVGHDVSEMADTDEEQFHGFNDHEISESADMYLGKDYYIDGQNTQLIFLFKMTSGEGKKPPPPKLHQGG